MRVLLIGLDSADADLIERWCEAGDLPNLASLRREGAWGRLGTTADILHVSAWPTLYTGASPGRHGMYHAYQVRAGEQGVHRARPEDCALPPFWSQLDAAGRACIIFDAFMDYPLDEYTGLQVLEYGTWTWFGRPRSTPRRLRRRLIREVGAYPAPEHLHVLSVPDPAWFRDRLVEGARTKGRAVRWLLREHSWDMAFVTFGEPHGGGHYLWHTGDPSHPASREYDVSGAPDALKEVYMAVDEAIGSIVDAVGDETMVAVFSGDGMGPNYSACHHMPELLRRRGWLSDATARGQSSGSAEAAPRPHKKLLSRLRKAVPLSLRQAVTRCLPRSLHYRLSMKWVNDAIDWDQTKVFCIPNSNEAYFRLNLAGREPMGRVEPGTEQMDIVEELLADVRGFVNPENGRAAVALAAPMDDVFPGEQRGRLPDVVASWAEEAKVLSRIESDRWGLVEGDAGYETGPNYTGNHRPNAFIVARGPHVDGGVRIEGGHIVDLAPTILHALGTEQPEHFEGRPLQELVR